MKKILAMLLCCVMVVAMFAGMTVSATEESATDAAPALEGYHAFMGIQTNQSWIFRDAYDNATTGYGAVDEATGVVPFNGLWIVGEPELRAGTFTDVQLDGDGTYTVSLMDPDFGTDTYLSLLYVSTNIPLDAGLTFSNVKVKMNNKTVWEEEEAFLDSDPGVVNCKILLQNTWNADRKDLFMIPDACDLTAIEISFDVSGFGYWAEGQEPAEEPAVDETPAADTTTSASDTAADTTSEGGCTGSVALPALAAVIMAAALLVFKKRA